MWVSVSITPDTLFTSSATTRATSALTKTMAVIMGSRYPAVGSGLVHRAELAALVERDQGDARLLHGVVGRQVAGSAPDRAGPLAVDVHQPDPGLLEPPQDLLGLLRRGSGRRSGATDDALGG